MAKQTTAEAKTSGFKKPSAISKELAAIVGEGPMPRTEVTKRLWAYIRKHDLQAQDDKRMIVPDSKLASILGPKPISMFQMTAKVSAHIK